MNASETTTDVPTTAHGYLLPEHLSATRWLALPELYIGGEGVWQDVSLRPETEASPVTHPSGCTRSGVPDLGIARLRPRGITVEICTGEVLLENHENAAGPHPRELLPSEAGAEAAFDVGRMAVYLARPFTPMEVLAYAEILLLEAGVPVASLEEVERDEFYGGV